MHNGHNSLHPDLRPIIVCLAGSTRFRQAFEQAACAETLAGRIVLSVGCFTHSSGYPLTAVEKSIVDQLHLRKIDMADELLVLNVNGYVGESTREAIRYAARIGKPIRFLHPHSELQLREEILGQFKDSLRSGATA
ncbi:MAG TPA: hypothetical protein VNK82_03595 [Terriglobales bacterium]|nr:hypothetical protein [Terriglobales bacterium]